MDKRYQGEQADILYNVRRCIHAAECVTRLSSVFDQKKRPWIDANGATADEIAELVVRCPSGALHVERKDGGQVEIAPEHNTITLWHNGPLQFHGDLHINGEIETRVTLCRCGASENKPYCDNAHKKFDFVTVDPVPGQMIEPQTEGGLLKVTPQPNGSIKVEGNFNIRNEAGDLLFSGTQTWLCRCGGSSNKPFCDGTHKRNGFTAS